MTEPAKKEINHSVTRFGVSNPRAEAARNSSMPEEPSTPKSRRSSISNTESSASSGKIKKLFHRSSHNSVVSGLNTKPAGSRKPVTSTPKAKSQIELPSIAPVKSNSVRDLRNKRKKRLSMQEYPSASATDNNNFDSDSMSLSYTRSEANSILSVPTTHEPAAIPITLMKPSSEGTLPLEQPSSKPTNSTGTVNSKELSENGDAKAGILSSFISAAAHHINNATNPEVSQQTANGTPENTKTGKSKFEGVLSSIKSLTGETSNPIPESDADPYTKHINNLVSKGSHSASSVEVADQGREDITKGIVFEAVKQTPLSTLGQGDLSLRDFEANHSTIDNRNSQWLRPDDSAGTTTIDRVMSPNGRQSRSRTGRASMSPSRRTVASPNGLSTKFSNSVDTDLRKRQYRKSFRKIATNTSDDTAEENFENDLSPTVSRVQTNGPAKEARQKPAKFIYANSKRQTEFHQLFKQVSPREKLVEDYSCALQKEILVQGRLYMSDTNLCFNSNILGWVTNFVIPFSEIIQIEKKNTAGVFPNAIVVQTLHSKSIFASFLAREATFEAMTAVWNQNIHGGVRNSAIYSDASGEESEEGEAMEEDDEEVDDDEEDDDGNESDVESFSSVDEGVESSSATAAGGELEVPKPSRSNSSAKVQEKSTASDEYNGIPFQGPKSHGPTENGYEKKANETLIIDEVIPAPLGVVYSLLFGDDSSFLRKTLEKGKNFDITDIPKFTTEDGVKKRTYTYTKPLGGPVGPKQTRCIINETIQNADFSNHVQAVQVSQSPDVPSGNSFTVKSFVLLSWAKNNGTRFLVLTVVEWTGKSWIKGAVEKGSIDGQKESMKLMVSELKSRVTAQAPRRRATTTGKKKSKKSKVAEPEAKAEEPKEEKPQNPLLQLLSTIGDLLPIPDFLKMPLGILFLICVSWTLLSSRSSRGNNELMELSNIKIHGNDYILLPNSYSTNNYLANKAEYDIWEWIDHRNGEGSSVKSSMDSKYNRRSETKSSKIDGHSRQSLEEALKLTQLKLDELRRVLDER